MKVNIFKNNKLLMSWTFSYIVIFLMQILMSIFVYTQSMNNVLKQIKMKNEAIVSRMQERVDTRIGEMEKVMLQIAQNPDVAEALKCKAADEISLITKSEISQFFSNIQFSSQFIDGIYLYLHEADIVLSNENVISSRMFYDFSYADKENGIEGMKDFLKERYIRRITSLELTDDLNNKTRHLAYMQSFPWAMSRDKKATLIIVAEETKFFNFQDIKHNFNKPKMFVTEEDFEILISDNSVIDAGEFIEKNKNILENAMDDYIKVDGNMVKITRAKEFGLKYFIIIDENSYARDFNILKLLIIIEILVANLIGIVLCIYLAKRNYMPVERLVKRFREQFSEQEEDMQNEMEYISAVVDKIVEEKSVFEKHISDQNIIMKDYYLRLLLSEKFTDDADAIKNMNNAGIDFSGEYFVVILVKIRDYDSFFGIDEKLTTDEKLGVVGFLIANVLDELFKNVCICHHTSIENNTPVYVANFDDTMIIDKLQDIIAQAKKFMQDNFAIIFDCAISDVHSSVYGLNEAYYEALLTTNNLNNDKSATLFGDIVEKTYIYPFTSEEEQKLKNMLRDANFEGAREMIASLICELVKNGSAGHHLQCLKYDILGAVLKTVNIEEGNAVFEEAVNELSRLATAPEIQSVLEKVIRYVCEYMKGNTMIKKKNELAEKIYGFVEENYANPDLNVAMIADYFGMSGYYVSLRFKEEYEETLKSFINRYKIEKSMELLTKTNMSIVEISSAVGFADSNAFIRVFKRYQTVTPAKYREGKSKMN